MQDVGGIVERLLGFLETGRGFVTAEAVIQLKDLLRRYPAIAEASLSSISAISPEVQRPVQIRPICCSNITESALLSAISLWPRGTWVNWFEFEGAYSHCPCGFI